MYYIPKIEEFHVGFEYETLDPLLGIWTKCTIHEHEDDEDHGNHPPAFLSPEKDKELAHDPHPLGQTPKLCHGSYSSVLFFGLRLLTSDPSDSHRRPGACHARFGSKAACPKFRYVMLSFLPRTRGSSTQSPTQVVTIAADRRRHSPFRQPEGTAGALPN